ncbi:MAG: hypothetical protein AAFN81_32435, partial [Bacteroidota bacterium]
MKLSTFCARLTYLSLAILFFSDLPAQVRFEADFNTKATGSSPLWITTVGNRIFFSADDGVTGREPWIYSPSVDQSFRLRDINTGSAGSFPWEVTVINEAAYFVAQNGSAEQLWVLPPGNNTIEQIPTDSTLSEIRSLTHYDDAIYFPRERPRTT